MFEAVLLQRRLREKAVKYKSFAWYERTTTARTNKVTTTMAFIPKEMVYGLLFWVCCRSSNVSVLGLLNQHDQDSPLGVVQGGWGAGPS